MGLIAIIKSFTRTIRNGSNITDVKCDPGGRPLGTYEHFADPGDDSFPMLEDFVAAMPTQRTGRKIAVGYMDTVNAPKATEGDKRIYARDVDGVAICEVWLKSSGAVVLSTPNSSAEWTQLGGLNIEAAESINAETAESVNLDAAESANIETGKQINLTTNDTNVYGNFNVDIGVSGIATPVSTVTFINGIAVAIT